MLAAADFAAFFAELHGCDPFPWQTRLSRQVAESGRCAKGRRGRGAGSH